MRGYIQEEVEDKKEVCHDGNDVHGVLTIIELEQYIVMYKEKMMNHCIKFTKDREIAKDIYQDAIYKILKYRKTFRKGTKFGGWAYRIIHNVFIDYERKKRHRLYDDLMYADTYDIAMKYNTGVSTSYQGYQDILSAELLEVLSNIDKLSRTLLLLQSVDGYSYKELAELFDMPIGTLQSKLYKAKNKVALLLDKQGAYPDHPRTRSITRKKS